jgi:hypothetical protein
MRTRFITCILLSLFLSNSAFAEPVQSTIGGVDIKLPVPAGFTNNSEDYPKVIKIFETMVPPANRALAFFISESDFKIFREGGNEGTLTRYFAVQTKRSSELKFDAQNDLDVMKSVLKKSQPELMKHVNKSIDALIADTEKKMIAVLDDPTLTVKVGEVIPRGLFNETPTSISLAMLTRLSGVTRGKVDDDLIAIVITFVVLKGKLVFFGAYGKYASQADMDWLVNASQQWAAEATSVN